MLGTQITKVRIMTPITKIETRTIIVIIPAIAPAMQDQDVDTINTTTTMEEIPTTPRATSRISQPMCK